MPALDQLTLGMRRKGKLLQSSDHRIIQNPCVQLDIPRDDFGVHRGLIKIAYLTSFRALGDAFVISPDGARYRSAIAAQEWDALEACQPRLMPNEPPILPPCESHEHLIACYRFGPMILTTVMLFGGVSLATFAIDAAPYPVRNLDGRVILVNAVRRTFRDLGLREAVPPVEIARRLGEFTKNLTAQQSAQPGNADGSTDA